MNLQALSNITNVIHTTKLMHAVHGRQPNQLRTTDKIQISNSIVVYNVYAI